MRILVLCCLGWMAAAAADSLTFAAPPQARRFADGAVEWSADLLCPDPDAVPGTFLAFAWDADLDGRPDSGWDTTRPAVQDCRNGRLTVARTFFPPGPALLYAELGASGRVAQVETTLAGTAGSLLAIRRFCARPENGEPEWVVIANNAAVPVRLDQVSLQGHAVGSGVLEAGAALALGPDSAGMARWIPGWPARLLSPWAALRNSGDTVRVAFAGGLVLDSAVYWESQREPREACADAAPAAAGFGFDLQIAATRWRTADGPLPITVTAPPSARFALWAYDLDGRPLCPVARDAAGPTQLSWSAASCPALPRRGGAVLLQLQPDGAPPLRRLVLLQSP